VLDKPCCNKQLMPLLCAVDPWRPATPHSEYADDREDTVLRPFKMIPGLSLPLFEEFGPHIRCL